MEEDEEAEAKQQGAEEKTERGFGVVKEGERDNKGGEDDEVVYCGRVG